MGAWQTIKDTATLPFRILGGAFSPIKNFVTDHKFLTGAVLALNAGNIVSGVTAVGKKIIDSVSDDDKLVDVTDELKQQLLSGSDIDDLSPDLSGGYSAGHDCAFE